MSGTVTEWWGALGPAVGKGDSQQYPSWHADKQMNIETVMSEAQSWTPWATLTHHPAAGQAWLPVQAGPCGEGGLCVPGPVYTSVMFLIKTRKTAAGVGIQSGLQVVWAPYVLYPGIVPYHILV
jgi:hypothetical protein